MPTFEQTRRRPRRGTALAAFLIGTVVIAATGVASPAGAGLIKPTTVYTANNGDSTISQFVASSSGLLSPLSPATVGSDQESFDIAASPDGKSVYETAQFFANAVDQYSVDPSTGALTPKTPSSVPAGSDAAGIAVSPDGKSVYVANEADSTVSQYDVGAGGLLTPKSPATVATSGPVYELAVSPNDKSVYVAGLEGIDQYDVGVGGVLVAKSPQLVSTGSQVNDVAVSRDGSSVYASAVSGGPQNFQYNVLQFDIGASGLLSPKSPATLPAGDFPEGVTAGPDGSVYVANEGDGTISQFSRGAGGVLVPKSPAIVATPSAPREMAIDPSSDTLYLSDNGAGSIAQFSIGAGGLLTADSPATVPSGSQPLGIAVRVPPNPFVIANGEVVCQLVGKVVIHPPLLLRAPGVSTVHYQATLQSCGGTSVVTGGKIEGTVSVPRDCSVALGSGGAGLGPSSASITWHGTGKIRPTGVANSNGTLAFGSGVNILQLPAGQSQLRGPGTATLDGSFGGNAVTTMQLSFDQSLAQITDACSSGGHGLKKLTFSSAASTFDSQ
jgi:DNA-binding beta-propeller fold protein YncE